MVCARTTKSTRHVRVARKSQTPRDLFFWNGFYGMNYEIYDILRFIVNMVFMRGYGSGYGAGDHHRPGLTDDQIQEMITTEVATVAWGSIPKLFGLLKNAMIELFE